MRNAPISRANSSFAATAIWFNLPFDTASSKSESGPRANNKDRWDLRHITPSYVRLPHFGLRQSRFFQSINNESRHQSMTEAGNGATDENTAVASVVPGCLQSSSRTALDKKIL